MTLFSRFISKFFGNPWEKPSQTILDHINDSGNGFEFDDLLSYKSEADLSAQEKVIIARIISIEREFSSDAYPVGTSNPASYEKLNALAQELIAQGK